MYNCIYTPKAPFHMISPLNELATFTKTKTNTTFPVGFALSSLLGCRLAKDPIPVVILQADLMVVEHRGALQRLGQLRVIIDDRAVDDSTCSQIVVVAAEIVAVVEAVGQNDGQQLIAGDVVMGSCWLLRKLFQL